MTSVWIRTRSLTCSFCIKPQNHGNLAKITTRITLRKVSQVKVFSVVPRKHIWFCFLLNAFASRGLWTFEHFTFVFVWIYWNKKFSNHYFFLHINFVYVWIYWNKKLLKKLLKLIYAILGKSSSLYIRSRATQHLV